MSSCTGASLAELIQPDHDQQAQFCRTLSRVFQASSLEFVKMSLSQHQISICRPTNMRLLFHTPSHMTSVPAVSCTSRLAFAAFLELRLMQAGLMAVPFLQTHAGCTIPTSASVRWLWTILASHFFHSHEFVLVACKTLLLWCTSWYSHVCIPSGQVMRITSDGVFSVWKVQTLIAIGCR